YLLLWRYPLLLWRCCLLLWCCCRLLWRCCRLLWRYQRGTASLAWVAVRGSCAAGGVAVSCDLARLRRLLRRWGGGRCLGQRLLGRGFSGRGNLARVRAGQSRHPRHATSREASRLSQFCRLQGCAADAESSALARSRSSSVGGAHQSGL